MQSQRLIDICEHFGANRYLSGDGLEPYREDLSVRILGAIRTRFEAIGLISGA